MRYFFYILFILFITSQRLLAISADELIQIHKVTTIQMNNIVTPQAGSLIYNTTENTLYFYTGTLWKRLRLTGSETIINAWNGVVITGNGTKTSPYQIWKN